MGQYGRESALSGQGDGSTDYEDVGLVVCEYPGRTSRCDPGEETGCCWHRCGIEPPGHLEYGRGSREPNLPQNGSLKAAPGEQAPASQDIGIKQPREGAQTGGTSPLSGHLPPPGCAAQTHDS